ncbi:response regulator [Roseomonas sp. SSH11]|uniref:Response regulator n=1 Tax=Pararoseomonas baculiformis TaxID=2820812 RepID=A0ABS4AK32_9PROT|nr:response regulator [Pararoseomonas baculiformis]
MEDEFLIADYLAMVLEDGGHEVVGMAGTAQEALDLLESGVTIDVVSLDVRLPGGMDGPELAALLRERGGPPFLFVTGSGDPLHRARCEAMSPLAILQKPIRPEAILNVLRGVERPRSSGHGATGDLGR